MVESKTHSSRPSEDPVVGIKLKIKWFFLSVIICVGLYIISIGNEFAGQFFQSIGNAEFPFFILFAWIGTWAYGSFLLAHGIKLLGELK